MLLIPWSNAYHPFPLPDGGVGKENLTKDGKKGIRLERYFCEKSYNVLT